MPHLRAWLLALLAFGMAGTALELLLLAHFENRWQLVPLVLIAAAFGVIGWHLARRDTVSLRALQATMALFIAAGAAGTWLHYHGAAEFQLEIDASQRGWTLMKKVMTAKAPPVLAPGVMMQLGWLGLLYTFRHPDWEKT